MNLPSSLFTGGALMAVALGLAGCGGGDAAPEPAASETMAPAAAQAPMPTADSATVAADGAPGMVAPVAPPAAAADPIRGPGGLESKCLAAVASTTNVAVGRLSTNRIDESEAATEIYINVPDAAAPWKCRGNRDGTVEGVEFTGSEGAL